MTSLGKVTIANKKTHKPTPNDIYAGRPSTLGNPYWMENESKRDEVCNKYITYISKEMSDKHSILRKTVMGLVDKIERGQDITLICFCYPKRCHLETIKNVIESYAIDKDMDTSVLDDWIKNYT